MRKQYPKQVIVNRQEAAPPFCPAMLALVPKETSPRGDAIAHIPMRDGRTIADYEEVLAERIALAWNSHEPMLTALRLAESSLAALGSRNATTRIIRDTIAKAEGWEL